MVPANTFWFQKYPRGRIQTSRFSGGIGFVKRSLQIGPESSGNRKRHSLQWNGNYQRASEMAGYPASQISLVVDAYATGATHRFWRNCYKPQWSLCFRFYGLVGKGSSKTSR